MKVAIYGSRHQDEFIDKIAAAIITLSRNGFELLFHKKILDYLLSKPIAAEARDIICSSEVLGDGMRFTAAVVLSIGGDGTFLRTAQWVGDTEMPIIGVNTGHLGFLAPFTIDEAAEAVIRFIQGKYEYLRRSMLKVDTMAGLQTVRPYALNELAIMKKDTASMITVDARINNVPLATYQCDGLIVSTPTGSTGYNLSVGGPIVEPNSQSHIISPIAAHSLTMRPLVVPADGLLEFRVSSRTSTFRISLDGRSETLPCGTSLFVTPADFSIVSVEKPGRNFYATLREKLLWGTPPKK